ncbi:hypothetical protein [Streptomyces sp. NPDC048603]|uniref:DUF7169 domain-containing protein n=1 Tax=Streptomyces sp. NPDC048603 TaxID=3365577 RepID=UPI003714302C
MRADVATESGRTAIAQPRSVTYGLDHNTGQRLSQLVDQLSQAVDELRQMCAVYDDAITARGRHPGAGDDGTGRRATGGLPRPTEDLALDDARLALLTELKIGAAYLPNAIAYVRGVTASMDRALSRWEGEDAESASAPVPWGVE